ncbi:hypothetical protein BRAS3843_1750016 [Bradyrhizobium sp. STM 3843]|nr:hypothetical protein BRAS3843_1750016 [Bradyrhizobium sp. STM 3843]
MTTHRIDIVAIAIYSGLKSP